MDETTISSPPSGASSAIENVVPAPLASFEEEQLRQLQDWDYARVYVKRLVDDWKTEVDSTEERRKTRDIDIDVQALRNDGSLDEDETLIPDRVIDENITREQPPFVNYLKNSRRIAIFTCLTDPEQQTQRLELEFTRGMTYTGWETAHFKCLDGSQTHGWDAVEVTFDTSKPFNVGIEHIGHDMLYYPRTNKDLQASSEVIRAYDVTLLQLQEFVDKFGFDAEQVQYITQAIASSKKEAETVRVYKRYKKQKGQVYVSWFCLMYGVRDWLYKPRPLFIGIKKQVNGAWVDAPVTMYPIFILPYRETEKPKLIDHKGRVFLDEYKQEAQTAILSGFVNGITRASNVYASPSQEDGTGASLKELEDVILRGGRILSKPVQYWSPPYPDPLIIRALQYMDTNNAQETNQTNFAVMNREDSRKTAKEIGAAQQQQQLLNSVQLTLFSTHIRAVYSFCWLIVQSQALQGNIKFMLVKTQQPVMNPLTGQPVIDLQTGQPMLQTSWVNDIQALNQTYEVRAAGDVDVIQKEETVMKMKQDWAVIANTALASQFLADLMRLEYPDIGEKYAKVLENQPTQQQQLTQQLGNVLNGILKDHPEIVQSLPPEEQQVVANLIKTAGAV